MTPVSNFSFLANTNSKPILCETCINKLASLWDYSQAQKLFSPHKYLRGENKGEGSHISNFLNKLEDTTNP